MEQLTQIYSLETARAHGQPYSPPFFSSRWLPRSLSQRIRHIEAAVINAITKGIGRGNHKASLPRNSPYVGMPRHFLCTVLLSLLLPIPATAHSTVIDPAGQIGVDEDHGAVTRALGRAAGPPRSRNTLPPTYTLTEMPLPS